MATSLNETLVVLRSVTDDKVFFALSAVLQAIRADQQALLAKLDADSGVNDTNYKSTIKNLGA